MHSQARTTKTLGIAIAIAALTSLASPGLASAQSNELPSQEIAGTWEKVPRAPWGVAYPAVAVVDGDMLVMEQDKGRMLRYDPESRTWRRLTRVPKRIETIGPSVWTGEEFVVFDELRPDRIVAYDPASDTWRSLPGSPLTGHHIATVADGRIAVAYVDQEDGVDIDRSVAVLDLATETWAELPPPTGRITLIDLFGWDSGLIAVTDDEYRSLVRVESLDFGTGTWSEPQVVPVRSHHAQPVWAGDRLVWSGDDSFVGRADASYDPETLTVVDEDFDCPISSRAALWTGELLVATNYTTALDLATGDCYRVPGRDRTMGGSAAAVWTGDRVIYWSGGGGEEGHPNPYRRDGHAFVFDTYAGDKGADEMPG